jgi:Na+/glutamate symporter
MTGAGELAMFLAIGAAAVGLFFGPIGSALAHRLGGRRYTADLHAEVEELGGRVTMEVDELRQRLAEVEERLDFAERLLTHNVPANQLPGGAQQ